MKHTQEKWGYEVVTLGKGYENQPALAITTEGSKLLAIIPSHAKGANHSEYIDVANLIAAAPELLEALEWCQTVYGHDWPENASIRDTIKKAKGE